jgi:hypothetical protein
MSGSRSRFPVILAWKKLMIAKARAGGKPPQAREA